MTEPLQILKQVFGYDSFRDCQEDIIKSVLQEHDILAIMPTGAGKSMCYQIPALMLEGITLVISPLISLMKDQVEQLQKRGIPAVFLNSTLALREQRTLLEQIVAGECNPVYISPERLTNPDFMAAIKDLKVRLVAVDEAHCVSQWGHNFRPSYRRIPEFIEQLPERPIIAAFTATATEEVAGDIITMLKLDNPQRFNTGYKRENLFLRVVRSEEEKPLDKDAWILDYVSRHKDESGIVYCATRSECERICIMLENAGIAAGLYHSKVADRESMQQMFQTGDLRVMVATNAFGMGIDKADIRYVLHQAMPGCIENYYQEAGRAGRDGKASECVLLFSNRDIALQISMMENDFADSKDDNLKVQLKERSEQRLKAMIGFCRTERCLEETIEKYFGAYDTTSCGHCGNCCREKESRIAIGTAPAAISYGNRYNRTSSWVNEEDRKLLSRLKECRRRIARENRLKSDFIQDSVLEKMLRERPQTDDGLIICGLSIIQADRYGKYFLEALVEK